MCAVDRVEGLANDEWVIVKNGFGGEKKFQEQL